MADISKVTLSDGVTYNIKDETARAGLSYKGVCTTAGTTPQKTVVCDGFELNDKVIIDVLFEEGISTSNPTLNVDDTGAKPIYKDASNPIALNSWLPGQVVRFWYDGANEVWIMNGVNSYVTAGQKSGQELGSFATAEGYETSAIGDKSHTEGTGTIAQRANQHVFGMYNVTDTQGTDGTSLGKYVEIVGNGDSGETYTPRTETYDLSTIGTPYGFELIILDENFVVDDFEITTVEGSPEYHLDNVNNKITNCDSQDILKSDYCSWTTLRYNSSTGGYSLVLLFLPPDGDPSYDIYNGTQFSYQPSSVEGGLYAASKAAIRIFDTTDESISYTYYPVDASDNRSNARTLDWDGNEVLAGKLTVGAEPVNDMDVTTKLYVDEAVGGISGGGGFYGVCDSAETNRSVTIDGFELKTGVAIDVKFTQASGYKNYLNVNSTGNKLIRTDVYNYTQKQTWIGGQIVRFVYDGSSWIMVGSGNYVTAGLADESITMGERATAEGHNATATGNYSHAEGDENTASGYASHAEGSGTTASGSASHAEGSGTTAQRASQHVFGAFNELDTSGASGSVRGQYIEIVGNGSSNLNLSNARTLDWDGNEVLAGKLTVGAAPTNDMDAATKKYVDGSVPSEATEDTYGLVKLNPSESVTLNASGQLEVGGRLGQMSNTTGVYSPKSINPALVGNGSFLLTEASGTKLGNKSLAVSTGAGLSLKTSAAPGATQYQVSNTYENRIICAGIVGGTLALNESSAATNFANITGVTINGSSFTPDSSANDSSANIIVTVDSSINPNSNTSSVRPYANEGSPNGFSNLFVGQQVGGIGGASVVVGQKVYSASGNACAMVGASMYNAGNGNAMFGRQHISKKNRWFMTGTGHDNSSGRSEAGAALGQWSDIDSNTVFAIGNGTSHTQRSNLFEIRDDGGVVLKDSSGGRWALKVSTSGTLTTTKLT